MHHRDSGVAPENGAIRRAAPFEPLMRGDSMNRERQDAAKSARAERCLSIRTKDAPGQSLGLAREFKIEGKQ